MPEPDFHLIWLTGACCDGCTIRALGDTTAGGVEGLISGRVPGIPRVRLHHPVFAMETGNDFLELMRRASRGELGPYGVVVEASVALGAPGERWQHSWMGEEEGRLIATDEWLELLSPRAGFVVAFGDCAVWGGPHALAPNPIRSTGVVALLGVDYRSTLGLPVINLPGCAPPHVLLATLVDLLRLAVGGPGVLELDELNRPRAAYREVWKGAFAAWSG